MLQWKKRIQDILNDQENDALVSELKTLIPEYKSNNSQFEKLDQHGEESKG